MKRGMGPQEEAPRQAGYRLPRRLLSFLAASAILGRKRSFGRDAGAALASVHPGPSITGAGNIPARSPFLLVCNHYSRPGLANWWVPLAASAAVYAARPVDGVREVRWITTSELRFPLRDLRRYTLSPLSRWTLARLAALYGFVLMPPMPPDPADAARRAIAVRKALRLARELTASGGILGLSPEGRDNPDGSDRLGEFPPGSGQFVALLAGAGLPVVPCGVSERGGQLRLAFGPPFMPEAPAGREERDDVVAGQVAAALLREMS